MKLIDVTNSYAELVNQQLDNTDTTFIRIFTLGKTTVIYTEAPTHYEIVLQNKQRRVKRIEVNEVIRRLVKNEQEKAQMSVINLENIVEVSFPVLSPIQTTG